MKITIDTTPHVGSRYSAADFKCFEISNLSTINNQQWVEYFNIDTKQTYSCLLDAFLIRFSPTI